MTPPRVIFNPEGSHSDTLRGNLLTVPQIHFRTARGGLLADLLVSFFGSDLIRILRALLVVFAQDICVACFMLIP